MVSQVTGLVSPQTDEPQVDDPVLPVDNTALSIAEILGIDLGSAGSAEQGTQIIVDAIYELIEQFQECSRDNEELQQQIDMAQQQADEQNQQLQQQQGQPGDPNGQQPPPPNSAPNEDLTSPDQQQMNNPQTAPPQTIGNGQAKPQPGQKPGAFTQKPQANGKPNPFAKKPAGSDKPNPFAKKPAVKASNEFTPKIMQAAATARQMQLLQLASDGYLTPHAMKQAQAEFMTTNSLQLSLSDDSQPDGFDTFVKLLKMNGPVISYGDNTYPQEGGKMYELTLEQENVAKRTSSVLVADAESRAAAAK